MINFKEKTVSFKNQEFNMCELMYLSKCYQVMCTMEYLLEAGKVEEEEQAYIYAVKIRSLMEKYGYTEEETINKIFGSDE